jgi:hypothetical protein
MVFFGLTSAVAAYNLWRGNLKIKGDAIHITKKKDIKMFVVLNKKIYFLYKKKYILKKKKKKTNYFKDKMTDDIPLVLYKGDILEVSSDVTANIVIEKVI